MKKKVIACSLLGMNRLSSSDTGHPFEMGPMFAKYKDTTFLHQVSNKEKTHSTLFYEVMKVFSDLNTHPNNTKFIFSRGTLGNKTEKQFSKELKKAYSEFDDDAFVVVVAKSYGGVDTLRSLKTMKNVNIDLLVLIDATAPFWSTMSITTRTRMNEKVFKIPSNVSRVWTVKQDTKGLKGKLSNRGENFIVENVYINSHSYIYDHYSDGYKRILHAEHNDMEEIASIVPVFKYKGMMVDLGTLIKNVYLES